MNEKEAEVYYIPIVEPFNITPFYGNVSSMNDVDTHEILNKYLQRFDGAWRALAEK